MNKISKILLGAAALTLGACSGDEPTPNPDPVGPDGKSTMYIDVNITSNAMGTRGSDGGWKFGNVDEHAVKNAYFYFFDKDGRFVTQATVWDGGNAGTNDGENVEYFGNNTLILRGLNKESLPKYLITVLNKPTDFQPGNTMQSTADKLLDISYESEGKDVFVMSTSSFGANQTAITDGLYDVTYPYANKLKDNYFRTDNGSVDENNRVNIYVERLAVKYSITLPADGENQVANDVFKIPVTIAGEINDQIETDASGHTVLYVKLLGYGVTGLEKKSKLSKDILGFQLTGQSAGTTPWAKWCDCDNYRSYWGKSISYGKPIAIGDSHEFTLNYTTFPEATNPVTAPLYSTENTNTPDNIRTTATAVSALVPSKVTCMLLTAQVFTDRNCTKFLELVDFNNTYFTREQFRKYVLQRLTDGGGLNYYKRTQLPNTGTGAEGDPIVHHYEYTQINANDIELVDGSESTTGFAVLKCKKSLVDYEAENGLYAKTGTDKWSETKIEDAINKIEEEMLTVVNGDTQRANLFKDGKMFYTIPIEHLNDTRTADEKKAQMVKEEGNYGVVRNHWYMVNVTGIKALGQGVFNPDGGEGTDPEPIIPENPNNERFAVGAKINILSWKIVNMNFEL